MNGLDKIITAIESEAQQTADTMLKDAQKSVEAIQREADENEAAWEKSFFEEVEKECKQIIERGASDDRQKRKGYLLKVRSNAINSVIDNARAKIGTLSDEKYFDFMYHIFVQNALPEEGIIHFACDDAKRLPDGFIERCNGALEKGKVTLGEPVSHIKAGFLIVYGKIEQNCSVESIFEANKNMLSDKVNEFLTDGM